MKKLPLFTVALAVCLVSATSRAAHEAPTWKSEFERARSLLLAGDFSAASQALARLVPMAPDPTSEKLASELLGIATTWEKGGYVLRHTSDLLARAPMQDKRTIDELAVLYGNAVVFGVGTGLMIQAHSKSSSASGIVLPALGLAGAAAGLVAGLDHFAILRYGVPQSITSGMYLGFEEAMVWTLWKQASTNHEDEWNGATVATLMWSGAAAGALAGGIIGNAYGTTPGRASFIHSAGLWSAAIAGTMAAAITGNNDKADDYGLLSAAIALNAGVVGGGLWASSANPSIARVRFIDLGGFSGALLFGGLYFSMRDKHTGVAGEMAALGLGMAAGVGLGMFWTRNMEPDEPRRGGETVLSSLRPSIAPAPHGTGMLVGVSGAL